MPPPCVPINPYTVAKAWLRLITNRVRFIILRHVWRNFWVQDAKTSVLFSCRVRSQLETATTCSEDQSICGLSIQFIADQSQINLAYSDLSQNRVVWFGKLQFKSGNIFPTKDRIRDKILTFLQINAALAETPKLGHKLQIFESQS